MKIQRKVMNLVLFGAMSLVMTVPSLAHAYDLAAVGALNQSSPTLSVPGSPVGLSSNSRNALGAGLLFGTSFDESWGIETGLLFMPRKYGQSLGNNDITAQINTLQIPIMARYSLSSVKGLSFGGGMYYAMGIGSVNESLTIGGQTQETSGTFEQFGTKKSDVGLAASIAYKYPLAPNFNLLADARYLYGLSNVSADPALEIKYRDLQFLAGVDYTF